MTWTPSGTACVAASFQRPQAQPRCSRPLLGQGNGQSHCSSHQPTHRCGIECRINARCHAHAMKVEQGMLRTFERCPLVATTAAVVPASG